MTQADVDNLAYKSAAHDERESALGGLTLHADLPRSVWAMLYVIRTAPDANGERRYFCTLVDRLEQQGTVNRIKLVDPDSLRREFGISEFIPDADGLFGPLTHEQANDFYFFTLGVAAQRAAYYLLMHPKERNGRDAGAVKKEADEMLAQALAGLNAAASPPSESPPATKTKIVSIDSRRKQPHL